MHFLVSTLKLSIRLITQPPARGSGLRNRLTHGYDEINLDLAWDIVQNELPHPIAVLETLPKAPRNG
jgi:uncharacterized protein with HEPN domain